MKNVLRQYQAKKYLILPTLVLFMFLSFASKSQVTGGEISYRCLAPETYEISMEMYWDCDPAWGVNVRIDPNEPALPIHMLFVYDSLYNLIKTKKIDYAGFSYPEGDMIDSCMTPGDECLLRMFYKDTINLPALAGGYILTSDLTWGNHRANNVVNVVQTWGSQRMIVYAKMPDPGTVTNSSPHFSSYYITPIPWPMNVAGHIPTGFCLDMPFRYDFSIIDPDGDSLAYRLCPSYGFAAPLRGIYYVTGYSPSYPIESNPFIKIDPVTGIMKGVPTMVGKFTFNVCVEEWRNGILIGEYMREDVMTVDTCTPITAVIETNGANPRFGFPDVIASCHDFSVQFNNLTAMADEFFWDFGVTSSQSDTSILRNPSYTFPDTGTYRVMLIAEPNSICADTTWADVLVYPFIEADFAYITDSCQNSDAIFTDLSSSTYGYIIGWTWWYGDGGIDTVQNPVRQYSIAHTWRTMLIVESSIGCVDTVVKDIIIYPQPGPLSAGFDKIICLGDQVQLQPIVLGNVTSWSWSPSTGLSNPNVRSPIASPLTTTSYYVTIRDSSHCTNTDSVMVTVVDLPLVDAGPDMTICNNVPVMIMASVSDTSGIQSIAWSPATGLSDPTIINPFANPTSTTNYTITITNNYGCISTDRVRVRPRSFGVTVNPGVSICEGDSVTISANASRAATYLWSPSTSLSNDSIKDPLAFPVVTTVFTVIATEQFGCSDTQTVQVTVNPKPIAIISPDTDICSGGSTTLSASGGVSYQWNPTVGLSNSNIANPVTNPLNTTTYFVNVTDAIGCFKTDSVTVTVLSQPAITTSNDTAICEGDVVQLNASGAAFYSWSPASSLSCNNCPDPIATLQTTSIYSVMATGANGCTADDSVKITVYPKPILSLSNDTAVCGNGSAFLQVSGADSYNWSPAGSLSCGSCDNPIASPSATTTYQVTGTSIDGCSSIGQATVNVFPSAVVTVSVDTTICAGESAMLEASGGNVYSWQPGSTLSSPGSGQTQAFPNVSTLYTVSIIDINGCLATDSVLVKVIVPRLPLAGTTASICKGESAQLSASNGVSYQWDPGFSVDNPIISNPVASPSTTTEYTVTISDAQGCISSDSVIITVNPSPSVDAGPDRTIWEGESVVLIGSGASSYIWLPSSTLDDPFKNNPIASPLKTTYYYVSGTSLHGCIAIDSVLVIVKKNYSINIANAFSPNGDGINDEFDIRHLTRLSDVLFTIYNRWGEMMFSTRDVSMGWDGRYNGVDQPLGTYVYVLKAFDQNGDRLNRTGNVTLLR